MSGNDYGGGMVMKADLDVVERNLHNGNYLAEQLRRAMLALIARIRELEAGQWDALAHWRYPQQTSGEKARKDEIRSILERGTVLP